MSEFDLKKDLNYSSLIINNRTIGQDVYQEYDKIMVFGGDNLRELLQMVELQKEKALVVSGSFDQSLECLVQGFKIIDAFDINKLSKHIMNLKIAAIRCLTYEEFVRFMLNFLDLELYKKLIPFLDAYSNAYFDNLLKTYSRNQLINLFSHFYAKNTLCFWDKCKQNFSFYNEKEFYELKERLNKVQYRFIPLDIFNEIDLQSKLKTKYDFIYLSNILFFASMPIEKFVVSLLPYFLNHLEDGGLFVLNYFHSFASIENEKSSSKNRLYQLKNKLLYQKLKNVSNEEFVILSSGFGHGVGSKDLVLAIKK